MLFLSILICTFIDAKEAEAENENIEYIYWLQNNIDPWNKVEEYWKNSYEQRQLALRHSSDLLEYSKKYPALQVDQGYKLVCATENL